MDPNIKTDIDKEMRTGSWSDEPDNWDIQVDGLWISPKNKRPVVKGEIDKALKRINKRIRDGYRGDKV